MNINAVVVSQLKKRELVLVEQLEGVRAALRAFGGSTTGASAPATVTRTRKKRKLSPDQIAKMVAGRQAARARANGAEPAPASEPPPPSAPPTKESHPRLPKGPKTASLAAAAEE